ncbi:hypothetical protein D3C86_2106760 [compost metagenome]
MAHLAHRLALALDHREDLQSSDKAITGCAKIGEYDMAGLFAADVQAVLAHLLDDITVADLRAPQIDAASLEIALEAEV